MWKFVATHRLFVCLLTVGIVLRGVAVIAYRPAMWFSDSYEYVSKAVHLQPGVVRPSGYSLLLWALKPIHSLSVVVLLQHGLGIGIAVIIYWILAARIGLPGWLASVAAIPVLFDAFQIELEHLILSDTLFTFLVVAAIALLIPDPSPRRAALAGLLLGFSTITRSVGVPLLAVTLCYCLVRRVGWRAIMSLTTMCALPILVYAAWYASHHGKMALTGSAGVFLYGRTTSFADCRKMHPSAEEAFLCVTTEPDKREPPGSYIWGPSAPLRRISSDQIGPREDRIAGSFARRAIIAQPLDYLAIIARDVVRVFHWNHPAYPDATTYQAYLFRAAPQVPPGQAMPMLRRYQHGHVATQVGQPYAGFLSSYQRYVFLRGPLLGLIMLIGILRSLHQRKNSGGHGMLPWAIAGTLIVTPAATAQFDYRYVLCAVPFACLAAFIRTGCARSGEGCVNGELTPVVARCGGVPMCVVPARGHSAAPDPGKEPERRKNRPDRWHTRDP